MIYTKTNPKGIDIPLQKIQVKVFNSLVDLWNLDDPEYNSYGRVYRNQDKDGKYIPEAYNTNNEYLDTLFDDRVKCTSFFGVSSDRQSLGGGLFSAKCHLIFSLDISQVRPDIPHRGDEEVHLDCINVLRESLPKDSITELIAWNDNVFREYNGFKAQEGVNFTDMHPRHVFRINFELIFESKNC